jgi:hypothetical protein
VWNGSDFNEKLSIAIKHEWPLPYSQINREYELAREALQHPKALLVRFEDIVGRSGGGTDERQQQAIINRWTAARMRGHPNLEAVREQLFGTSATFRRGQIGGWREHFQPNHEQLFETHMGHLLDEWDYRQC